jgi:hypothetical protein
MYDHHLSILQELQSARGPEAPHGVPQRRHHPLRALQPGDDFTNLRFGRKSCRANIYLNL